MTKRILVVATAVALILAACGGSADASRDARVTSTTPAAPTSAADEGAAPAGDGENGDGEGENGEGDGGEMSMEEPEVDEPIAPMGDAAEAGEEALATSADSVMIAAAIDVQAFWDEAYPEVYGEPYVPIEGGFWSYGPDTPEADLPPCDVASYDEIAENAFYCPSSDLIAWDREALIGPFIDEFGAFTGAIVMAHELGHAIQGRTGDFDTLPGVISELQADCFAGAWVAYVAEGNSDSFDADVDELDVAVAGLVEIRDAPGSDPNDPAAHGSGFDRVSGFADGLVEGAARCATYGEEPPVVTEQLFDVETGEDATGGDLSPDDLLELLIPDLEDFYTQLFATQGREWVPVGDVVFVDPATEEVSCGDTVLSEEDANFAIFYCIDDNVVYADAAGLLPALEEIGDFALGVEIARQWAFAAQVQTGNTDTTRESFLHADCLTGLYSGDLYFGLRETQGLGLSAGDLDEALISFLAFGESEEGGSPFERSDAFRTGFLGDITDCDAILG